MKTIFNNIKKPFMNNTFVVFMVVVVVVVVVVDTPRNGLGDEIVILT